MKKIIKNKIIIGILIIILSVTITFLSQKVIYSEYIVNGTSMEPNLMDKSNIKANKLDYKISGIKRFDIIIFEGTQSKVIKRVVGLPGETLEYIGGKLYINGKIIEENFLDSQIIIPNFNAANIGEVTIPENSYFVMGDNRGISIDSRRYGSVKKSSIIAVVED
ncbi:MAG: signal peptidase I [Bacilli bacterium]